MSCFDVFSGGDIFNLVKGFHQVFLCIPGINNIVENIHGVYNPFFTILW